MRDTIEPMSKTPLLDQALPSDSQRLDRTQFKVFSSFEEAEQDEREYWLSKSLEERFLAIEQLRQQWFGYDPATARLQRVLSVAQQTSS